MKLKTERTQFGLSMFCRRCHAMLARTKKGECKCRRCQKTAPCNADAPSVGARHGDGNDAKR